MRAWLLLCAALALAPRRATAAHPHPHSARADRIKTLILAKLGLSERPTPLGAPPRDVVRQILARAVDQHPPAHDHEADTAMREVIAIAHRGETLNGQRLIEFRLGQEAEEQGMGLRVASAELMVRAETPPRPRRLRYTLWAFTVSDNSTVGGLAGATRRDPSSVWQRIDVTTSVRAWAAGGGRAPLRLLLDCSGCGGWVRLRLGGAAAARPLLRVRLHPPAARRRRALDCDAAQQGRCCRQTYYVSFRALGWDDWIVAPEGYYANYCRGACSPLLSYHSQMVEAGARGERAPCCAPTRFSALSLIYFGADANIIKRDLPEMVVEECDCP